MVSSVHQDCSRFTFKIHLKLNDDPSKTIFYSGYAYFNMTFVSIYFSNKNDPYLNAKKIIVTQKNDACQPTDSIKPFELGEKIPVRIANQICQLKLGFGDHNITFADLMFYEENVWRNDWTRFTQDTNSQVLIINDTVVTGNSTFTCDTNSGNSNSLSMCNIQLFCLH